MCSQHTLARVLGISLGSVNHAVQILLERGWIQVQNLTRSDHPRGYRYRLTPDGLNQKADLADRLLQRKRAEHQALLADIEQLCAEVQAAPPEGCERGLPRSLDLWVILWVFPLIFQSIPGPHAPPLRDPLTKGHH